jgi:hypothetical protein
MMLAGIRVGRVQPEVAGVCLLAVLVVVLIDIKVMYAFSRNGFTAMLIPVLTAWWELSRIDRCWGGSRIGNLRGDVSWT